MNSKAMQVKVQREKESCNGTMKENHNRFFLIIITDLFYSLLAMDNRYMMKGTRL